jgi:Immunity protein 8
MRAVLRRLHSPDADPLSEFAPHDPEAFSILVQALVGPSDGEGEESFDFLVCTPRWLAAQEFEKGFVWPRSHLLLQRWDYTVVERAIGDVIVHAEGPDWPSVAAQIGRYGGWELEGYTA